MTNANPLLLKALDSEGRAWWEGRMTRALPGVFRRVLGLVRFDRQRDWLRDGNASAGGGDGKRGGRCSSGTGS
jgi:hypothetical protein